LHRRDLEAGAGQHRGGFVGRLLAVVGRQDVAAAADAAGDGLADAAGADDDADADRDLGQVRRPPEAGS
jgi:hypothetical protein